MTREQVFQYLGRCSFNLTIQIIYFDFFQALVFSQVLTMKFCKSTHRFIMIVPLRIIVTSQEPRRKFLYNIPVTFTILLKMLQQCQLQILFNFFSYLQGRKSRGRRALKLQQKDSINSLFSRIIDHLFHGLSKCVSKYIQRCTQSECLPLADHH